MSNTAEQVAQMVSMLPDSEQVFALEFVKRLVLAWDTDFTKTTPTESTAMAIGLAEIQRGEVVLHDEIDWS
jgi:hypothetical protein